MAYVHVKSIATCRVEIQILLARVFQSFPPPSHSQHQREEDQERDEETGQLRSQELGAEATEKGGSRTSQLWVPQVCRVWPRTPNCKYPYRDPQSVDADEDPLIQEQLWKFLPQPR